MRSSKKKINKKNKSMKCIYTDEAKRIMKAINDLKKKNKNNTKKNRK